MPEIDAILFDVGNVLIEWDPRHLYRQILSNEAAVETFLDEVCTPEWHFAHDLGVSFEENAAPLKERHPEHGSLIDQWGARYMEMVPGEIAGMAAIVAELSAAGLGVHGLTNMPSSVYPMLRDRFSVMSCFETIVVSGDEGVCKPDPRIFELSLERIKMSPEKILFVDDSVMNIDSADGLGFQTHHFKQSEGLRARLVENGVLGA